MTNTDFVHVHNNSVNFNADDYDISIVLAFNTSALAVLVFTGISLIAFQRTKGTPKTAKFLSSALIIFDFCTTLCFALRKCILNERLNVIVNFIGLGWSFLAYINVAIMSVERLLIFEWPNFYLRHVSYRATKRVSIAIWTIYIVSYTAQFIACFYSEPTFLATTFCLTFIAVDYVRITFPLVALLSIFCFATIIYIIKKQATRTYFKQKSLLQQNKPTLAVFMCVLSFILTTGLYTGFAMIASFDINTRRLILDGLAMVNELVDTCVYVIWYQETRLELIKMFSFLHPTMMMKADKMKIKIFRIVTFDKDIVQESTFYPGYPHSTITMVAMCKTGHIYKVCLSQADETLNHSTHTLPRCSKSFEVLDIEEAKCFLFSAKYRRDIKVNCCDENKSECYIDYTTSKTYYGFHACSKKSNCSIDIPKVVKNVLCTNKKDGIQRHSELYARCLFVKYNCVPMDANNVVNMCSSSTKTFESQLVNVIYEAGGNSVANKLESCTCEASVSSGTSEDVKLNVRTRDVRLERSPQTCSSATLKMEAVKGGTAHFVTRCVSGDDLDSSTKILANVVNITLDGLHNKDPQDVPKMVWFSISESTAGSYRSKPRGKITITCSTTNSSDKRKDGTAELSAGLSVILIIVLTSCVCTLIGVAVVVWIYCRGLYMNMLRKSHAYQHNVETHPCIDENPNTEYAECNPPTDVNESPNTEDAECNPPTDVNKSSNTKYAECNPPTYVNESPNTEDAECNPPTDVNESPNTEYAECNPPTYVNESPNTEYEEYNPPTDVNESPNTEDAEYNPSTYVNESPNTEYAECNPPTYVNESPITEFAEYNPPTQRGVRSVIRNVANEAVYEVVDLHEYTGEVNLDQDTDCATREIDMEQT